MTNLHAIALCIALAIPATLRAQQVQPDSVAVDSGGIDDTLFLLDSYRMARLYSPFAAFDAPEASQSINARHITDNLLTYAHGLLGSRYRRGGRSPKGFDCSGFTSYVFSNFGIELLRSSREQYTQGQVVSTDDLRPGDLLFFSSRGSGKGVVGHVGIVAEVDPETRKCRFIHSSTTQGVVYDTYPDNGYYSRTFIGARRVIR